VVGVLTLAGAGAALVYFSLKGVTERQPTEDERRLVLTSERLGEYGIETGAKLGTMVSRRNIDGTRSIEFEYDSEKHAGAEDTLYVISEAEINRNQRDARQSFTFSIAAMKGGLKVLGEGTSLTPAPALLTFGDQRYAAYMKNGDHIVGNVFVFRQGRVLHSLILAGVYLDDPEMVRELFEPLVQESERQFGAGKQ
jgi:hypothetical protein